MFVLREEETCPCILEGIHVNANNATLLIMLSRREESIKKG
jgi:hypothetical protein